jgi:hypothetical protein
MTVAQGAEPGLRAQVPPVGGCRPWDDVPEMDANWVHGRPPAGAGSLCAQQGKGNNGPWAVANDSSTGNEATSGAIAHTLGGYCVSKATGNVTLCTQSYGVPEQINVQIAGPDSVVVSFVTFETAEPTAPPTARVTAAHAAEMSPVVGVTHRHDTLGNRTYFMHFVRLTSLKARAEYSYTVKSGAPGAVPSRSYTFRAPYSGGPTKIALYGDMGVYTWNNMGNLYEETVVNKTADLIIHAGDHCYNEGDVDERRADGYMQAFENTLANSMWMPVVGNHEFVGTKLTRVSPQLCTPIPALDWPQSTRDLLRLTGQSSSSRQCICR